MTALSSLEEAATAAVQQISDHPRVCGITMSAESGGCLVAHAELAVNLPSRAVSGVSATGVRDVETLSIEFPPSFPYDGPTLFLRRDFPSDLPHINPHQAGDMVPPCVFQGSLNDLLHTSGIDAIIDQAADWLDKAASGQLIDPNQGWEPTRRGEARAIFDFDGDQVLRALPKDGQPITMYSAYYKVEAYAAIKIEHNNTQPCEFTQEVSATKPDERPVFRGSTAVVVAMAPWKDEAPVTFATYHADTVHEIKTLEVRVNDLGIEFAGLRKHLESFLFNSAVLKQGSVSKWPWQGDILIGIVLAVKRPCKLIGSSRDIELIPYLLQLKRDEAGPDLTKARLLPAYHVHRVSQELLSKTSGYADADLSQQIALLGCGSLGSKISLHLGRAGFGQQMVSDHDVLMPHNLARHALLGGYPLNKAMQLANTLMNLGHFDVVAAPLDIVDCIRSDDDKQLSKIVPTNARLILDTTASPQVAAALTHASLLAEHSARLARAFLYNRGQAAIVLLEGKTRSPRCDDLLAELFENCRHDERHRTAIQGISADLVEVFVGDNCRSITMPMPDSVVSRAAASISMEIERWLVHGLPEEGLLLIGCASPDDIGFHWQRHSIGKSHVLTTRNDAGWSVRISDAVAIAIDTEARQSQVLETGGVLLGHIDTIGRTITIAGLIAAPPDSQQATAQFMLGVAGLQQALREAHVNSIGYLHYVGTWHSHPMGGAHSALDRQTLRELAKAVAGLPFVSLIWKPDGFACEVDRVMEGKDEA
jgi:hypothetical protein